MTQKGMSPTSYRFRQMTDTYRLPAAFSLLSITFLLSVFPDPVFSQCANGGIPSGSELVANGNFSVGDSGFSSSYTYCNTANCLFPESYYTVATTPSFYHPSFTGADHTTGSGNFMIINGASTAGVSVWCETFSVTPGTDYLFSTWVCTLKSANTAKLQFSINGVPLGNIFNAPILTNWWLQFFSTWNSGTDTVATICIVNQNTVTNGNDFGLDDISFQPCTCAANAGPDMSVCLGNSVTLTATGGGSYLWNTTAAASSITVSPALTSVYTVTVTAGSTNGCTASDSVKVTVLSLPPAAAGPDTQLCAGDSTLLTASGGTSYLWNTSAATSSIMVAPPSSAVYWVSVSDGTCAAVDSVSVTVLPLPPVSAGPDTSFCMGDSITLTATGASAYLWNTSETTLSVKVAPSLPAMYYVTGTDGNCFATDTVVVTPLARPLISAGSDTAICPGDSLVLTASGGTAYLWNTMQATASVTVAPSSPSAYYVTGTDGKCFASDTVFVMLRTPPAVTAGSDTLICSGNSVVLKASGGITYIWSTSGTADSILVTPASTAVYTVTGTDGVCYASDSVMITVDQVTADAGPDVHISRGQSITLGTGNSYSCSWNPSSGLSCDSCCPVSARPDTTTVYVLTVTDSAGCSSSDTVTVYVDETCGTLYIPNAFSPNDDGQNDRLFVRGNCITEILFEVYDRWGEKVFETHDVSKGWDGRWNGNPMNEQVLAFCLKALFSDGSSIVKKGTVSLLR